MTKTELEEALAASEKKVASLEKKLEKAKDAPAPPASVADIRVAVEGLLAEAVADPGDGVLLHHLTALESNLQSLEQVDRLHEQMQRPEGE